MSRLSVSLCDSLLGCVFIDKLIVVGGSDGVKSLSSTEMYDPERREWTAGPKMTSRRANVNVAEIGGKVFAVGGFSGRFLG